MSMQQPVTIESVSAAMRRIDDVLLIPPSTRRATSTSSSESRKNTSVGQELIMLMHQILDIPYSPALPSSATLQSTADITTKYLHTALMPACEALLEELHVHSSRIQSVQFVVSLRQIQVVCSACELVGVLGLDPSLISLVHDLDPSQSSLASFRLPSSPPSRSLLVPNDVCQLLGIDQPSMRLVGAKGLERKEETERVKTMANVLLKLVSHPLFAAAALSRHMPRLVLAHLLVNPPQSTPLVVNTSHIIDKQPANTHANPSPNPSSLTVNTPVLFEEVCYTPSITPLVIAALRDLGTSNQSIRHLCMPMLTLLILMPGGIGGVFKAYLGGLEGSPTHRSAVLERVCRMLAAVPTSVEAPRYLECVGRQVLKLFVQAMETHDQILTESLVALTFRLFITHTQAAWTWILNPMLSPILAITRGQEGATEVLRCALPADPVLRIGGMMISARELRTSVEALGMLLGSAFPPPAVLVRGMRDKGVAGALAALYCHLCPSAASSSPSVYAAGVGDCLLHLLSLILGNNSSSSSNIDEENGSGVLDGVFSVDGNQCLGVLRGVGESTTVYSASANTLMDVPDALHRAKCVSTLILSSPSLASSLYPVILLRCLQRLEKDVGESRIAWGMVTTCLLEALEAGGDQAIAVLMESEQEGKDGDGGHGMLRIVQWVLQREVDKRSSHQDEQAASLPSSGTGSKLIQLIGDDLSEAVVAVDEVKGVAVENGDELVDIALHILRVLIMCAQMHSSMSLASITKEQSGKDGKPAPSALVTGLLRVLPVLQEYSWDLTLVDDSNGGKREGAAAMAREILELAIGTDDSKGQSIDVQGINSQSNNLADIIQRYISPTSQRMLVQASRSDSDENMLDADSSGAVHAAMGLHELLTFISASNVVTSNPDALSIILNACLPLCLSSDNYLQTACLSALAKIVMTVKSTSLLYCLCLLYGLDVAVNVYGMDNIAGSAGSGGPDPIALLCGKMNIHLNSALLQLFRQHSVNAYRLRSFVGEILTKVIGALSESAFVGSGSKDFHFVSPDLAYTMQGLAAVCIRLSKGSSVSDETGASDGSMYDVKTGKLKQAVRESLDSLDTQKAVVLASISVSRVYLRQSAICMLAELLVYLYARYSQEASDVRTIQAWDNLPPELTRTISLANTDFYSLDTLDIALGIMQLEQPGVGKNKDVEKSNAARRAAVQCLRVLVEFNHSYFFDFNETEGFHRLPYITNILRQCAAADKDPVVRHQAEVAMQLIKQCGEHYLTASSLPRNSLETLLRIV